MNKNQILECIDPDIEEDEEKKITSLDLDQLTAGEILELLDTDQIIDKLDEFIDPGNQEGFLTGNIFRENGDIHFMFQYLVDMKDEKFDRLTHFATETIKTDASILKFLTTLDSLVSRLNEKLAKGTMLDKNSGNYMELSI